VCGAERSVRACVYSESATALAPVVGEGELAREKVVGTMHRSR
jgi:hypothetical protein